MTFLASLAYPAGSTLKSWLRITLKRGSAGFEILARPELNYAPNLLPAVLSGNLVAFSISMGEFEVSSIEAGFGTVTLPLLLIQSLRGNFRVASAVASLLLYTTLLALLGLSLLPHLGTT